MSVLSPYPTIGWEARGTHTADPRVPVLCGWCLGVGVVLERMELGAHWEHLPVRCPNCRGAGVVRIERRRGAR